MNRNLPVTSPANPTAIEHFYQGERAPNAEMKCPLVLVLDRSASMEGDPIKELNRGLKIFQTQIQNDEVAAARLEVAVVSFSNDVRIERDFSLFENTAIPDIQAAGGTDLASGVLEAITRIEARKAWYKEQGLQYYRPYIVVITDGYPTSSKERIDYMIEKVKNGAKDKRFSLWAFGVENADMDFLKQMSPPGFPPQKLKGINFGEFFRWLSSSFSTITASKRDEQVDISPKPGENPFQITVY